MRKFQIGDYVSTKSYYEIHPFKKGEIVDVNYFSNKLYYKVKTLESYSNEEDVGYYNDLQEYEIEPYVEEPVDFGIKVTDILLGKAKMEQSTWYAMEFKKYPHILFKVMGVSATIGIIDSDGLIFREYENDSVEIYSTYKLYEWDKMRVMYNYDGKTW